MTQMDDRPGPDDEVPEDLAADVGVDGAGDQREPKARPAGQERTTGILPGATPVEPEVVPEGVREAEKAEDPTS